MNYIVIDTNPSLDLTLKYALNATHYMSNIIMFQYISLMDIKVLKNL